MSTEGNALKLGRRGLLVVMTEVPSEHEAEFNRWYTEEHLPERAALDGFLSARRFVAVEGSPKYLALYDLESPDVLQSKPYSDLPQPTPWTERIRKLRASQIRNVYQELI